MAGKLFMSSVEESVSKSMREGKILVVYNSNGDDSWLDSWFQGSNENDLKKHAVWLILVRGTEQFTYFEQIFPSVEVPSFYLIQNGQILSTIQGKDFERSHWSELTTKLGLEKKQSDGPTVPTAKTLKDQVNDSTRQKYNEQLLREKKNAYEEKERILKLVEADRAERRARRDPSVTHSAAESSEIHDNIKNLKKLHAISCTLLIKLTNGKSISKEFGSQITLNDVRKWVDIARTDKDGPYAFHRSIPRVTFTDSDELKSLEALELLPRSVLIVKPLDNGYGDLNVAEAKGPGLLGKVFSGISSWWAKDGENTSKTTNVEDQKVSAADGILTPDLPASGVPTTNDEIVHGSPSSSRIDSPVYSAHEYHLRHNPSELSLPSRCVTPNVYHFVNAEDEDKDRSTYNGNTVNLEKKKKDGE